MKNTCSTPACPVSAVRISCTVPSIEARKASLPCSVCSAAKSCDPSRLTSSSFVIIAKNKDFKSLFYEIVLFLELSDYDLLDADCKILEEGDNFSRLLGYAGW